MSSGLPVIASDWDGLRDTVVDGETGILLPTYWMPGNDRLSALSPVTPLVTEYLLLAQQVWIPPAAIENALARLFDDSALRSRLGAAGRARAAERFSRPANMARWHEITDVLADAAARETPSEAERRRAGALQLGLPTPYTRLFAHYATTMCHNDAIVALTDLGKAASAGKAIINFYDETVPLMRQPVVEAVLSDLAAAGDAGISLGDLTQKVGEQAKVADDDVRMHLAFLLKQDVLDLRPTGGVGDEAQ
jgi:hypothetical protein